MSQRDDSRVLHLTQSEIPPEIRAYLGLLLHQTLACTVGLRSRVAQVSWHVTGIDVAPLYALLDAYIDLATTRLAGLGGALASPQPSRREARDHHHSGSAKEDAACL